MSIVWNETHVKYLDHLSTVDIKHEAPHRQRYRCEKMIFMRSDEPKPQARPLWKREDYNTPTGALMCLQQEHGKGVLHIPIQMRTRQYNTLDPTIQQNLEWLSQNVLLETDFILFFVMVTKLDMVEFSTLEKFSTVARVATRRMARPKVVGKMVSESNRRFMFTQASGN